MRIAISTDRFNALSWVVIIVAMAGGCASIEIPTMPSWPASLPGWAPKKDEAETPANLAVVWTATVLQGPNTTPTRGFGGLLTFYGEDRKTPIKVDGQLTVYAYMDAPGKSDKAAPDAKFIFTPEQFAKHYGQSALGHSYSIWIPWDKAGGPQQELMLTACFKPVADELVMGKPARVVLEGPSIARRQANGQRAKTSRASHRDGERPVSHDAEPSGETTGRRMTITTLSMPGAAQQ